MVNGYVFPILRRNLWRITNDNTRTIQKQIEHPVRWGKDFR